MKNLLVKQKPRLCEDLINYICFLSNIECHICKNNKNIYNFYKKQNKFYYCSKSCYEFV